MQTKVTLFLISILFIAGFYSWQQTSLRLPETSHGAFEEPEETVTESAKLINKPNSVIFTGDVMLGRHVENLMRINGFDYPFSGLNFSDVEKEAYVVGNFESAIPAEHKQTPNQTVRFSVDKNFLPALRQAGFSYLSLANNHTLDYGEAGFESTVENLIQNNFAVFGNPAGLDNLSYEYIELGNFTIAIIGIVALDANPSQLEVENLLEKVSQYSDFQIAYVHWGTEYSPVSNKLQKQLANTLTQAGVDLVIGHHPHVVQEIALVNGVPVFYSLGNYIFDQYFSPEVQNGLLLHLIYDEPININLVPVTSIGTMSKPRLMNTEEASIFLNNLAIKSEASLSDEIKSGFLAFNTGFATSSKIDIIGR